MKFNSEMTSDTEEDFTCSKKNMAHNSNWTFKNRYSRRNRDEDFAKSNIKRSCSTPIQVTLPILKKVH